MTSQRSDLLAKPHCQYETELIVLVLIHLAIIPTFFPIGVWLSGSHDLGLKEEEKQYIKFPSNFKNMFKMAGQFDFPNQKGNINITLHTHSLV